MGRIQDSNWPSWEPTRTPLGPATVKGWMGWVGRLTTRPDWVSGKAGIWAFALAAERMAIVRIRSWRWEVIGGQFSSFVGFVHLVAAIPGVRRILFLNLVMA